MNEIAKIISQLEHQKAAIERAISALREIEGPSQIGASTAPKFPGNASQKRHISPEGRKRIAEALRRRWAAKKSGKGIWDGCHVQESSSQGEGFEEDCSLSGPMTPDTTDS